MQQTSVSGLYVAGDVTGIEEAPIAMEEGRLAGISTAEAAGRIDPEKAGMLRADTLKRISMMESGENGESRKMWSVCRSRMWPPSWFPSIWVGILSPAQRKTRGIRNCIPLWN